MDVRMLLIYAILPIASATFVSTPGIQKFSPGSLGAFRWAINGTVVSYNFFWSSGSIDLSRIVTHIEASFIFVAILNVQLSDAGNYTLQVNFAGDPLPSIDTTACLYIYNTIGTVTQTEGTTATTVNEGSPVKFTCSASSTSLPAQFRPDPSTLVYTIYVCNIGYIQRQSDGSVIATNTGKVVDRYVLIDNQTLRINPVKVSDNGRCVQCRVCEDNYCFSFSTYLTVTNFKPLLDRDSNPYMKYTAGIGKPVTFTAYYSSNPAISSYSWSFSTSQTGPFYPLPASWTTIRAFSTNYEQLAFNITSSNQYGFFLLTLTNSQGTSIANFQVNAPGGLATKLIVQCYELKSLSTTSGQFSINASTSLVNMTIPAGAKYQFNLLLYNGGDLVAYQTVLIPGGAAQTDCGATMTAVIILAVFLGVAVMFGLSELAWILNNRCRATKNTNSSNELSQVPTVSDKVRNDYTEQSFYTSLSDQTGASTEDYYEDIQNGQGNTRTQPRRALPLPNPPGKP